VITFTIPLRTVSGNHGHGREHWAARARRVKKEREATAVCIRLLLGRREDFSPRLGKLRGDLFTNISLTRVSPRGRLLDTDNLSASMKSVRDEIAKQLGVSDAPGSITWEYSQERGEWGVEVILWRKETE